MTISQRMTRAGIAFTIFGFCASLLPNDATAITGADACNPPVSNSRTGIKSSVVATDVVLGVVVGGGIGYLAPHSLAPHPHQSRIIAVGFTPGLPAVNAAYDAGKSYTDPATGIVHNYYDFSITGFTKVGAHNASYSIDGFSNSSLEKMSGVVGVTPGTLPSGWTFDNTHDFHISTTGIYPDDPDFGLIFLQKAGTTPIDPTGAVFTLYHVGENGIEEPFKTKDGQPLTVIVNSSGALAPSPAAGNGQD